MGLFNHEYGKGLENISINLDNAWSNVGKTILVDALTQTRALAMIVEPYDPDLEEDDDGDVKLGDVFWCARIDSKFWDKKFTDGIKGDRRLLAVHYMYMYKPIIKEWDTEENKHA